MAFMIGVGVMEIPLLALAYFEEKGMARDVDAVRRSGTAATYRIESEAVGV